LNFEICLKRNKCGDFPQSVSSPNSSLKIVRAEIRNCFSLLSEENWSFKKPNDGKSRHIFTGCPECQIK
jgi:hypothetical protein